MKRRVVVTGAGCITPLGVEIPRIWERLLRGESGAGPITQFDATTLPVRMAAEVSEWDSALLGEYQQQWRTQARQTQFIIAAARRAIRDTGLDDLGTDPLRRGVFLGCGEIFPDFTQFCNIAGHSLAEESFDVDDFLDRSQGTYGAGEDRSLDPGLAAGAVAGLFDAQGPNANFTAACVSSSKAIGEAAETVRNNDADVVIAGGSHSMIHPFGITGFHRLSTLNTNNDDPAGATRPFDRNREGFVVGEGGAVLVLEELGHAMRRGAEIWAEVTGWGASHDAYRITDLDPEGRAAARSMTLALADAKLNPEDIDYINAHGSATQINDKAETLATKRALGNCAYHVPMSSTKSMTGHLTTACGAIESFFCVMAIRENAVPPTINYQAADPLCDLDYVPNVARSVTCNHVMNNNFGFGGQNVSLIFSRYCG